jgi:hypothetical protein
MSDERLEPDDPLGRARRRLPPAEPRPAFTARVLARLDRRPRRSALQRVPAWAAAAATVVALVGGFWGVAAGRHAWREERRRTEMRAESAALARELATLQAEASKPSPVVYLGGNERVDVVLDLSTLPIAATVPSASSVGAKNRP